MRSICFTAVLCLLFASAPLLHAKTPAEKLRNALLESSKNGVLFGHHDDTLYGHDWFNTEYGPSDIYNVTGKYPALLSFDLAGVEVGKINYQAIGKHRIIKEVADHHKRGGFVAFSWHATNPSTRGNAWDISDKHVVESILEDGDNYERYCNFLDSLAVFFKSLKDENGEPIGVLFRPYHEFQGPQFWWTKDNCSDSQFVKLWRNTVSYLKRKGVNNVLYVFSPSTNFRSSQEYLYRYPGDKYVDVLACELYRYQIPADYSVERARDEYIARMKRYLSVLSQLASKKHKLYAVAETGIRYGTDSHWWTKAVLPAIDGYSPCYVNVWRNTYRNDKETYCTYPGDNSENDFVMFSRNSKIKFVEK